MVWSPSDRARAAVLAERWGGVVSYTVGCGGDGVCVQWSDGRGYTVTLAGADAGEVLGMLSTVLRDMDGQPATGAGHIHNKGMRDGDV
jgi:hypothetical protein